MIEGQSVITPYLKYFQPGLDNNSNNTTATTTATPKGPNSNPGGTGDPLAPSPPSPSRDGSAAQAPNDKIQYRGFQTSISHIFRSLDDERTDACALACCGILQSDRDRFLVTGVEPPSCLRRTLVHILGPILTFFFATWAAFHIPDKFLNQIVCTLLVVGLAMHLVLQCCKGRWKRTRVRKELLWRKYRMLRRRDDSVDDEYYDDDPNAGPPEEDTELPYLQGQTALDLCCAHAFLGCYSTDLRKNKKLQLDPDEIDESDDAYVPPHNLLSQIWNAVSRCCCGDLCGCYLQVCGMCALAQEARELERLMPPARRRIDYVTMQSWKEYYPTILQQRTLGLFSVWRNLQLQNLSRLSKQLLQAWLVVFVLFLALAIWKHFSLLHMVMYLTIFVYAWVFLWVVHWPWYKKALSTDAVIKAFSAGFILSVTLAVAWETVIGLFLRLILDILMMLFGVEVATDDDGYQWLRWATSIRGAGFAGVTRMAQSKHQDYVEAFGRDHPFIYIIFIFLNAYFIAAFVEEISKYLGYRMITDHPDLWTAGELAKAIEAAEPAVRADSTSGNSEDDQGEQEGTTGAAESGINLQDLSLTAQERTRQTQGAVITILMMAVALGFACCENLLYVFIYNENDLLLELVIMIDRMLFPLHPLCAAIQSVGVVKRDIEKEPNNQVGKVLLPSVIIHGTFDFLLLLTDFLDRDHSIGGILVSFCGSIFVMSVALVYYYKEGTLQRLRLRAADQQTTVDQSNLL